MRAFTKNRFHRNIGRIILLLLSGLLVAGTALAQSNERVGSGNEHDNANDQPKSVKEFLAKQRLEKEKKDYEELLKRGDELVVLTKQLEAGFERNTKLTSGDQEKLVSIEKLLTKIRKGLGGDGDDEDVSSEDDPKPNSLKDAMLALKEKTGTLISELKKTSRFTISAAAIQSSNAVLKIVRFLQLRK